MGASAAPGEARVPARVPSRAALAAAHAQPCPRPVWRRTEYMMKLEAVAGLINQWKQQDYVRQFFAEPPTAYRGLPSRPRWDTGEGAGRD